MTYSTLTRLSTALGLTILLAACGGKDIRFSQPDIAPSTRVSTAYRSIEVATVSLPTYAESEEIMTRAPDGGISALGPLWADEPERAVTLQIARDLGTITGRLSAPEPWPFRDYADVKLDVRIESFVATVEGLFVMSGQYFVAPDAGGANRAKAFRIAVPIAGEGGPEAISAARAAAVTQLAVAIAKDGLR